MDEELAPFLKVTEELQPSFTEGAAVFHPRYLQVGEDQVPLLLVRSKIGLVNAASAVTEAISSPRTAWASLAQVPPAVWLAALTWATC